jgi:hypothetical protein
MMSILDKVAGRRPRAWFRPTTVPELFALRLAQKLGEPSAAEHYADLIREHSESALLQAYRQAVRQRSPIGSLGRHFHVELASAKERPSHSPYSGRLLAIKVERRVIAVTVFAGSTLDFHDSRHLSSHADKAQESAVVFLNWVISNFDVESATLERITNGNEIRRAVLSRAVLNLLRASATALWEVSKRELLEGYGHPPLRSRAELRQVAHAILWPMFHTDSPNCQEIDAAAVGLHVQTERPFLKN